MWSKVEDDFAAILTSRVFPTVANTTGYVILFSNAGLQELVERAEKMRALAKDEDLAGVEKLASTARLPANIRGLPPVTQRKLAEAARIYARLLRLELESMKSLRERRAKAVILEGPQSIYRLWSQKSNSRIGPWWFTEGILQRAMSQGSRQKSLDWLRNALAVSLDWSDCDRIAQLDLHPGNAIPAVEALGLPVRQYSMQAALKLNSENQHLYPLTDYYARYGKTFEGERTQYYLPFVPTTRVHDFW